MSGESFLKPIQGNCRLCGSPLEATYDACGFVVTHCLNPDCPANPVRIPLHRPTAEGVAAVMREPDDRDTVRESDWREFDSTANDYGVPDRAGLQSVVDAIGGHYLHLAREYGWLDTEVRDAVYVETKRRGWCPE